MSKEQVMDYVMTTPSNPNRAVLSGMLDSIADASSGGGGTSLVTNKYELAQSLTINKGDGKGATWSFSEPISKAKIRAIWIETNNRVVTGLSSVSGNGDDIYTISYYIAYVSTATSQYEQSVTIKPTLYITMEE